MRIPISWINAASVLPKRDILTLLGWGIPMRTPAQRVLAFQDSDKPILLSMTRLAPSKKPEKRTPFFWSAAESASHRASGTARGMSAWKAPAPPGEAVGPAMRITAASATTTCEVYREMTVICHFEKSTNSRHWHVGPERQARREQQEALPRAQPPRPRLAPA